MSFLGFKMWEQERQWLIEEHQFFVDQANSRLLSQFDNIEAEANKAADAYLARMSSKFDPDKDDPTCFYDFANDRAVEFGLMLSDMKESTRLGLVAGMFHQWDKKLREWIVNEIRKLQAGENAIKSIWSADFSKIVDFLNAIGFDAKIVSGYERLNALRMVVNVYKHGDGSSLEDLKVSFPEFIENPTGDDEFAIPLSSLDHTFLKITDVHFKEFSEAIVNFLQAIPSVLYLKDELNLPDWYKKAVAKDEKTK